MQSPTALLIIDYTNDFVDERGALTCGQPAQQIATTIVSLADRALKAGQWVILPTDVHQPHDPYTRRASSSHPTTNAIPGGASSTARLRNGTKPTRLTTTLCCSIRPVTRPFAAPVSNSSCRSAASVTSP